MCAVRYFVSFLLWQLQHLFLNYVCQLVFVSYFPLIFCCECPPSLIKGCLVFMCWSDCSSHNKLKFFVFSQQLQFMKQMLAMSEEEDWKQLSERRPYSQCFPFKQLQLSVWKGFSLVWYHAHIAALIKFSSSWIHCLTLSPKSAIYILIRLWISLLYHQQQQQRG